MKAPRQIATLAFGLAAALHGQPVAPTGPTQFGRIVELPPLIVNGQSAARPWRYVELPGVRVLSRVPDAEAIGFLQEYLRTQQLLGLFLPPEMEMKMSAPRIVILGNQGETVAMQKQLLNQGGTVSSSPLIRNLDSAAQDNAATAQKELSPWAVRFLSNLGLEDVDTSAVYVMLDDRSLRVGPLKPAYENIRHLVDRRTPTPPSWMRIGVEMLNEGSVYSVDRVVLPPPAWTSMLEVLGLRNDSEFPRTLLPMREILEGTPPAADDVSERAIRWRAQVALFTRWALSSALPERKASFWRYVDRVCAEVPTEQLFRECFGMGYSDMRDVLSDYLPIAVQAKTVAIQSATRMPTPTVPRFRDATATEVARVTAEWERLEVPYVQEAFPEYADKYRDQVRNLLADAAAKGIDDRTIRETAALERCDSGDDDKAEPILRDVAAYTLRPRVHYELARIWADRAVTAAQAAKGQVPIQAAQEILDQLVAAAALQPSFPDVYTLAAKVLVLSEDGSARPKDLALLADGLKQFPRQFSVTTNVVAAYAHLGMTDEAHQAADLASRFAPNDEARAVVAKLLAVRPKQ